ncbi:MAG: O-antigen ligase family protein [Verrucomicrobiota bacterium]
MKKDERLLQGLLLAFAFCLPLSIALAEPLAFLAVPVWLYGWLRRRGSAIARCPYAWPVLFFLAAALVSAFWGVRPLVSLAKCHRLFLLFIIFMMPAAFPPGRLDSLRRAKQAVFVFVAACALRGLYDVVRVPVLVGRGMSLFDTGNMRDPQLYMVALCFLLAGWGAWSRAERRPAVVGLLATAAGLVLHFKRGAWFSFVLAVGVLGAVARRYKAVAAVVVCGLALLLAPQVRERLERLRKECSPRGGRYVLWTQVAPALLREHPAGMGLGAVRASDFRAYARGLEPKLNHLHNNVLQVAVELGWAGLAVWLWWMATALAVMYSTFRRAERSTSPESWIALGTLGAFCALLLNGAVEYNFGDSEVLMLYCFLMGLSCVIRGAQQAPGARAAV